MIKQQGTLVLDNSTQPDNHVGLRAAVILPHSERRFAAIVTAAPSELYRNLRFNMVIVIQKYSAEHLDAAVSVLADAFVTNPLHVAAFGPQRMDQSRLFFRIGLRHMFIGQSFVAMVDGKVRGYTHFNPSPRCLPAPEEIPLAAATLLKPLGGATPRVVKWFARWCHLDPDEPHVHLGPIAVSPEAQGQGVGTALMNRYIDHLKDERAAGYLETDKAENVAFYKKFGFVVQREEDLIGTPVWYMWRGEE